jgi:hypothetical protein
MGLAGATWSGTVFDTHGIPIDDLFGIYHLLSDKWYRVPSRGVRGVRAVRVSEASGPSAATTGEAIRFSTIHKFFAPSHPFAGVMVGVEVVMMGWRRRYSSRLPSRLQIQDTCGTSAQSGTATATDNQP